MNPNTLVLSIGRRQSTGEALTESGWLVFKQRFRHVAFRLGDPVFAGEGLGWYQDTAEDAYTIILTDVLPPLEREGLYAELRALARYYRQDCVAVVEGTALFLEAQRGDSDAV